VQEQTHHLPFRFQTQNYSQSAVHATFVQLKLALCFNNRLHFVQQRPRVGPVLYFAVLYCHTAVPHRYGPLLWSPCVADVDIIFLPCGFDLLLSSFPRLISAVADWMSTIRLHMVWS